MNATRKSRTASWLLTLAAALSGGSVCSDCQTTFRDAVVTGTRDYILNDLLNPANFIIVPEDDTTP